MEYEVSIEGMSIDEIANKIKAFRNNEQVMSVCLLVRRRTDTKSCIRP